MRTFSHFEKEVLKFMVYHHEPQDVCAISLFEKFCDCYLIKWSEDYHKIELVYDSNKDFKEIRQKIIDIVVLLTYLEKNDYIGLFALNLLKDKQIFNNKKYEIEDLGNGAYRIWYKEPGTIKINHPLLKDFGPSNKLFLISTKSLIENTSIGKQIELYANASYHITQTLKDFVDNDFKTTDDLKFQKTYRQAWIGIVVAILIGIASIIITIYCSNF